MVICVVVCACMFLAVYLLDGCLLSLVCLRVAYLLFALCLLFGFLMLAVCLRCGCLVCVCVCACLLLAWCSLVVDRCLFVAFFLFGVWSLCVSFDVICGCLLPACCLPFRLVACIVLTC